MQRRKHFILASTTLAILTSATILWPEIRQASIANRDSINDSPSDRTAGATALAPEPSAVKRTSLREPPVSDLSQAVTRFKSAHDCLAYHTANRQLQQDIAEGRLENLDMLTADGADQLTVETSRFLHVIDVLSDSCHGTDPQVEQQLFDSALWVAATAGDTDAQACYVLSGPTPGYNGGPTERDIAQLLQRYLTHASAFTHNALERGDPRIGVAAMEHYVHGPRVQPTPVGRLTLPDPLLTRSAAGVALRIALPEQREQLQELLQAFDRKNPLSPSQIQQADQWAARHVARHYLGQPAVNIYSPVACYARQDLAP